MAVAADGVRRPAVMADVARLAGVSLQTVSRVVNGGDHIRPETRARVQEAIGRLGYRPNKAARALATTRTATIGVIVTEGSLWGPRSVQRTVEQVARQAGYFVGSVSLDVVARPELTSAVDHLLSQSVEGVIMIAGYDEALQLVRQQDVGVPFVVVMGDVPEGGGDTRDEQFDAARRATRHLLELGHVEVAHVAGPANWVEARAREAGWRAELAATGLRPAEPLRGDWSAASGYAVGRRLAADEAVTAVFAANDEMALGVLRALAEAGRAVPGDVSVVGFDDIPSAEYLVPPLTTMRQDMTALGRLAVCRLDAAIRGSDEELPPAPAVELVVRASTGPRRGPAG
ncbi:LacI family DNA-binding transcriptional regulator [Kineococcus glutinatus]|uniref:LacI family DNA-binding transcriptional regulator n=1 Tax=Kineococcus glutinatus TaxID=1070872 RepID=A0ABP9HE10_9ACTN